MRFEFNSKTRNVISKETLIEKYSRKIPENARELT